MARFIYPTLEEVEKFESSYLGPQTKKLEELRQSYCDGEREDNDRCLICFELAASDDASDADAIDSSYIRSHTCPRVLHRKCLTKPEEWKRVTKYCPLCIRRGWVAFDAASLPYDNEHGENEWMRRLLVMYKWTAGFHSGCFRRQRQDLVDDGSLDSDRALLLDLGIVKREVMLFNITPNAETGHAKEGLLEKRDVDERDTEQEEIEDKDVVEQDEVVVNTEELTNGSQTVLESGRIVFDGNEVYVDVPDHIRIRGGFRDSGGQLWVPQNHENLGPSIMRMRRKTYVHYD